MRCYRVKGRAYAIHVRMTEYSRLFLHATNNPCHTNWKEHIVGVTRITTTLSYNYRRVRRAQIQYSLEAVISLLRVPVPIVFTFVVAFSDHDIRIPSLSSADSLYVSRDRSLRLWISLSSL